MNFLEALKLMKQGYKVKLPTWGGYWYWDAEKETIMMHTKDDEELDIRETDRVEYTLSNVMSNEWEIAGEENTPVLGGVARFSFSDALKYLRRGLKVARAGWNGKGIYVIEHPVDSCEICTGPFLVIVTTGLVTDNLDAPKCIVPWFPSQTDLLSDDWIFVE